MHQVGGSSFAKDIKEGNYGISFTRLDIQESNGACDTSAFNYTASTKLKLWREPHEHLLLQFYQCSSIQKSQERERYWLPASTIASEHLTLGTQRSKVDTSLPLYNWLGQYLTESKPYLPREGSTQSHLGSHLSACATPINVQTLALLCDGNQPKQTPDFVTKLWVTNLDNSLGRA